MNWKHTMSTDLLSQLRRVGDALDEVSTAVEMSEIIARETSLEAPPSGLTELQVEGIADRRRPLLLSVAASILVIGMISGFLLLKRGRTDEPVSTAQPASSEPRPTTSSTSAPTTTPPSPRTVEAITALPARVIPLATSLPRPDVFPALPVGDERDVMFANYSGISFEAPDAVAALVARVNGNRLEDGIRIETAREGTNEADPGSSTTATVALPSDPRVSITGLDPATFLEEAGANFATADWSGDVGKLVIDSQMLPDGYEIIVEPGPVRRAGSLRVGMAVKHGAGDGVGISVELDNPLLFLAVSFNLERVDINGIAAWQAPPGIITWRVSTTTWVSVARNTDPEAALRIARDLEFVDEATWRERYRVGEPALFADQGARVAIDRGRPDGLAAGMPVENAGFLIGKLGAVTESTSEIMLLHDPQFTVAAAITPAGSSRGDVGPACSVVGRNDHIAYICDAPFGSDVVVGASVSTVAGESDIPAGIPVGTITTITKTPDGEPFAIVQGRDFVVVGDELTVLLAAGDVASLDGFCKEFTALAGERPESYVGSAEHLADIERLLALAPEPIVGDLAVYRDFLDSGAIDSENDPDSNLFENWPNEVQAAVSAVQTLGAEQCPA
jgi:hypothetical protein